MAFANSKFISLLLIVAISGLVMISAEEEVPSEAATTGNRQSKQIYFVPQLTPASSYPAKYFSSSPYALPLMMPKQTPFIRRPIQQQQRLEESNWPYTYPVLSSPELKADREEDETPSTWRDYHQGFDDYNGMKWWKKGFNREATIIIKPAATECLIADMAANGLGPCKRASQANHGTIDINLPAADQTAVIAITAHSPENTRVRLICTDITDAAVFTQTGRIAAIADTPRTEMGYMHIVVTSTGAPGTAKCYWLTYRHYTATYP